MLTVGAALALARLPLPAVVTGFLALYLIVLAAWPEVNALAIVGPHPDGGGRFYGITNRGRDAAARAGARRGDRVALAGRRARPRERGLEQAGADGGGILVFAVGLATLRLRLAGRG